MIDSPASLARPRSRSRACTLATCLSSVVFVVSAVLVAALVPSAVRAASPGDPAPRCDLEALADGARIDTASFAGSVVLVDFWASWCAPCAHAFRAFDALVAEHGDAGLVVLGVGLDDDLDDARAFAAEHGARLVLASDPRGACPRAFDLVGMPSSYLVDRHGVVRAVHRGYRPSTAETLRREIALLLAEPAPSAPAGELRSVGR